jgi:opacity protein-like surface antigen
MKRIIKAAAGLSLGLMATAGIAGAQDVGSTRAVSFGIAGGATIPTGDVGDFYGTGFNVMGTLGFQPVAMPVGVRFDVAWHNLGLNDDFVFEDGTDLRVLSGTANAVLTVSNTGGMKPYLIGGVGVYNMDAGGSSETKFGLNGGGGIEFPLAGFSTFVEARYHHVFTDSDAMGVQLVPIVFGIKF